MAQCHLQLHPEKTQSSSVRAAVEGRIMRCASSTSWVIGFVPGLQVPGWKTVHGVSPRDQSESDQSDPADHPTMAVALLAYRCLGGCGAGDQPSASWLGDLLWPLPSLGSAYGL